MRASTGICAHLIALVAAAMLLSPVQAAGPRVGVAPFIHEVPNIRTGLAAVFTQELQGNGRMTMAAPSVVARVLNSSADLEQAFNEGLAPEQQAALSEDMDYLLLGKAVAFGLAAKDKPVDHSRDLNDWGRMVGGDSEVAQAYFELRMLDLRSGETLLRTSVEGLESKHGTRLRYLSYGWLGTIDLTTDGFRRTTLGRATYKALGALLYEIYPHFPLTGEVLAVSGDTVVLDLDTRSGIRIGDELSIYATRNIFNALGQPVYRSEQRIGGAQVVELKPGRCLCLLLDGAEQVQEGDRARPLQERWVVPEETEAQPGTS
jgi:hypothetical protein